MMKKGAFIVNYARADVIQKQVSPVACCLHPDCMYIACLLVCSDQSIGEPYVEAMPDLSIVLDLAKVPVASLQVTCWFY